MTDDHLANQQLTPRQQQDLHAALNDAFNPNDLARLLRNLGVNYDQIVPAGAGKNDALDHIVRFTVVSGQPHALINGALAMNTLNKRLSQFAAGLPAGFLAAPVDEAAWRAAAAAYRSLPL